MQRQIVGTYAYLSDILELIQEMMKLRPQIELRKKSMEEARKKVEAKKSKISGGSQLLYFFICALPLLVLFLFICWLFSIRLIADSVFLTAIILAFVTSAICVMVLCALYRKRVIEPAENEADAYLEAVGREQNELKLEMKMMLARFETFTDKLNKECRHSLSVYLMQQSVKDGVAMNAFQAQKCYLKTIDSPEAELLSNKIAQSKQEMDILQGFISRMDNL